MSDARRGADVEFTVAPGGSLPGDFEFLPTDVAGRDIRLRYGLGRLRFEETVSFPFDLPDEPAMAQAVHVLHLIAGVSYYKLAAPTTLVVPTLSAAQWALVERLYDDGLREFAYRNGLDVPLPVDIRAPRRGRGDEDVRHRVFGEDAVGALIPIGGGKDSALVASLVPDGTLFAVNPVGAQERLAEALGRPLVGARRVLDPQLRELNEAGAPNGHVPVTAITSAVSVIAAIALDLRDVVMGIERSADEPTVVTPDGVPVNHQFSKSTEAERLLRAVFAPLGVRWFSLLRPLTELAIGAGVAARGLADDIVSCNRVFTIWNETTASREQRPCGTCAKCLFTALMLAPSLEPDEIEAQYGNPIFDRDDHVEPVRELWSTEKPFECVGERLETAAAVVLLADRPAWRDHRVIRELAPEAAGLLEAAGATPAMLLEPGPLDELPEEYRPALAALLERMSRR